MLSNNGGLSFTEPAETWQVTMSLAFIEVDGRKILHQLSTSNAGRVLWRPIIEISAALAENERS